jgi:hypothetical protein
MDSGLAVGRAKATPVGQVVETDTAHAVAHIKIEQLGQAQETDTALPVTFTKRVVIGAALETDTARLITARLPGPGTVVLSDVALFSAGLSDEAWPVGLSDRSVGDLVLSEAP